MVDDLGDVSVRGVGGRVLVGVGLTTGLMQFALLFLAGAFLWIDAAMGKGEDMPVGDPFLQEGLEFHL